MGTSRSLHHRESVRRPSTHLCDCAVDLKLTQAFSPCNELRFKVRLSLKSTPSLQYSRRDKHHCAYLINMFLSLMKSQCSGFSTENQEKKIEMEICAYAVINVP